MSDTRWQDVDRNLRSARRNIAFGIDVFDREGLDGDSYAAERSRQALMHALQTGYTSIESAFRKVLAILDEEEPTGADWHRTLLERVAETVPDRRPAVIDGTLYRHLDALMRFRHVAMHGYDSFDPARAAMAIDAARFVFPALFDQIQRFRTTVDPDI